MASRKQGLITCEKLVAENACQLLSFAFHFVAPHPANLLCLRLRSSLEKV